MDVIIWGGFLGSGKTSLLIPFAKYLVGRESSGKPSLVIIENEIGQVGIDDRVLKAEGLTVRELFAGCVCCQLSSSLITCLNELKEQLDPRWVIIEATGVALPQNIAETLATHRYITDIKTVVIVDAQRWNELSFKIPMLVETPVSKADVVLINKIDLVGPVELESIEASVRKLNHSVHIHKVSARTGINQDVWGEVIGQIE